VYTAVVALLLASAAPAEVGEPAPAAETRWFLGIGGRNAVGLAAQRATTDFGADVLGGVWLLHEHLLPIVDVGWSSVFGTAPGYGIDTFRAGGELAAGTALVHDRLWVGGSLGLAAQLGWLHVADYSLGWSSMVSASVLVLGRFARHVVLGVEVGPAYSIPALSFSPQLVTIPPQPFVSEQPYSIFNSVRLWGGLRLGWIFGNPIP